MSRSGRSQHGESYSTGFEHPFIAETFLGFPRRLIGHFTSKGLPRVGR